MPLLNDCRSIMCRIRGSLIARSAESGGQQSQSNGSRASDSSQVDDCSKQMALGCMLCKCTLLMTSAATLHVTSDAELGSAAA